MARKHSRKQLRSHTEEWAAFIELWESCNSAIEVAAAMRETSAVVRSRAARIRAAGLQKLKLMAPGPRVVLNRERVKELQRRLDEIQARTQSD